MLDEVHKSLRFSRDRNSYTLGRMGVQNVAAGEISNNRAVFVATQLLNDFPSI